MVCAKNLGAALLAAGALVAAPGARADMADLTSPASDPSLIALGVGDIDFDHHEPAGELRGEYRFAQGFYFIKPMIGAFGTSRHQVYAYGGFRLDFVFLDHFAVTPNAAVGYYNRGNGKDLGSPVEFKTGLELAYRFDNAARLGVAFDHISNAGLTKLNPGTEQLLLVLSWPVPW
jgi:lipid A 3-O-deacylase